MEHRDGVELSNEEGVTRGEYGGQNLIYYAISCKEVKTMHYKLCNSLETIEQLRPG